MLKQFPQQIKSTKERIAGYEKDFALYEQHSASEPVTDSAEDSKFAGMTVKNISYTEKAQAGAAILEACKLMTTPEPQELVRFSGNVYTTRNHDSLKISNGKWRWWLRGIGGRSALDYLIKVRGMTLPEAVPQIDGQAAIAPPVLSRKPAPAELKKLLLPEKNENNDCVIAYLTGRGIHSTLIDYCLDTGRLYESQPYHNAVFIGLTAKVHRNMQPFGEPQTGDIWEKPTAATSISPSQFPHGKKVTVCTCLKAPLIYYPMAHWICFPAEIGERKTTYPLQGLTSLKKL